MARSTALFFLLATTTLCAQTAPPPSRPTQTLSASPTATSSNCSVNAIPPFWKGFTHLFEEFPRNHVKPKSVYGMLNRWTALLTPSLLPLACVESTV
jgi:hypothetical protein